MFVFRKHGKHRDLPKDIKKKILHGDFASQHGGNFEVLKIKGLLDLCRYVAF